MFRINTYVHWIILKAEEELRNFMCLHVYMTGMYRVYFVIIVIFQELPCKDNILEIQTGITIKKYHDIITISSIQYNIQYDNVS